MVTEVTTPGKRSGYSEALFPLGKLVEEGLASRRSGAAVALHYVLGAQGLEYVGADCFGAGAFRRTDKILHGKLGQRGLPLPLAAGDQGADDLVGRAERD